MITHGVAEDNRKSFSCSSGSQKQKLSAGRAILPPKAPSVCPSLFQGLRASRVLWLNLPNLCPQGYIPVSPVCLHYKETWLHLGFTGGARGKEPGCQGRRHETQVPSLDQKDPLEEDMAPHSSILAWRIPTDRGAWWATVHRVAKKWTRLKWLSMHTCDCI